MSNSKEDFIRQWMGKDPAMQKFFGNEDVTPRELVRFVVHEDAKDEWVLRATHPDGHMASIGALNGKEEAKLICGSLNLAVQEDASVSRAWLGYFGNS